MQIKLLRAHGGCLGAKRRRRTWLAAISLGELRQALIRGFPNGETRMGNTHAPPAEHIGRAEGTEGTETSKYLEEKKSFPE